MCEINLNPTIRELTLKHGIEYPCDAELIMMILGSGTKDMPVEKLSEKVVETLGNSNPKEIISNLLKIQGMGLGKAMAIASALELGRRRNNYKNAIISSPIDIIPFIQHYSMQKQEHFLCITLNGAHEIIQIHVVSIGTVNQTLVHPREVFSHALLENAAGIIVAHNHPSGTCRPSPQDIKTTETLTECSHILRISLFDHIIFSSTEYFSFLENEMIK